MGISAMQRIKTGWCRFGSDQIETSGDFPIFSPLISPGVDQRQRETQHCAQGTDKKTKQNNPSPKGALYFWSEEWVREPYRSWSKTE